MHAKSITAYLRPYSIVQKRITTIRNAFAQAEASSDGYDLAKVVEALTELYGEMPPDDLICVYCDKPAETWDHLYSIVQESRYSGYGHRIRNLVPCCKGCNTSKQHKNWEEWLRSRSDRVSRIEERIDRIRAYSKCLAPDPESGVPRTLRDRYTYVMMKVIDLLAQADRIAVEIRKVRQCAEADPSRQVEAEDISRRLDCRDRKSAPILDGEYSASIQQRSNAPGTGSKSTGERIIELVKQDPTMRYEEIARRVRKEIPGARTSAKSVASTVMHARKEGRLRSY